MTGKEIFHHLHLSYNKHLPGILGQGLALLFYNRRRDLSCPIAFHSYHIQERHFGPVPLCSVWYPTVHPSMWHSASVPKQKWDFQFRLCCVWSFSSDQSSDLQLKQVSQLSKVALLSEERKRINMIHQKYWHKRCLIFERFLLNSHTACLYQARRYVLTHWSLSERKWKVIWILLSQFLLSLCSFTENTYNWNPKTLQIL